MACVFVRRFTGDSFALVTFKHGTGRLPMENFDPAA
jgi:hypothetical protein